MEMEKLQSRAAEAAKLLKVLGNAERLLILCQLLDGEHRVGELCEKSVLSQSAFSQHLAVLRRDELVKTRKEAQTVYYSLANEDSQKILATLQAIYCPA
ncbi:MAG: helix-turn-helix transcriptional regulator [Gammaproteobacteria bacterium]|nr:helix-turn-helix transcriptional regulator [Gammaproteobacteria bacterium]